jgi:hypothetical protein
MQHMKRTNRVITDPEKKEVKVQKKRNLKNDIKKKIAVQQ